MTPNLHKANNLILFLGDGKSCHAEGISFTLQFVISLSPPWQRWDTRNENKLHDQNYEMMIIMIEKTKPSCFVIIGK